ncbi:alpha/beta fold hydrolase [Acinetobacter boissieri]|uniref:Non-heme chloroperoxidase n=1 Tax=Acinetobacter boissieri TaxID=1219383 RepID=A0A1G6IUG7_9GAMM|nr:alpha/beta hydrolase [Acinetobacter boissieri]SDC09416.1 non-heme chloroperoxidase [Acinetobacter boissieri]
MPYIKRNDELELFYKDWGRKDAQAIFFHHGWPLSADDWDNQLLFFLNKGYRVIASDRRGHGRSSQIDTGHDMDHYADDVAHIVSELNLENVIHVGHSAGGGQIVRYVAKHGPEKTAKIVLIGAVPPLMVQTEANPNGLPKETFDGFQVQLATNRAHFFKELPSGPFYGYNTAPETTDEAVIQNWWRQAMMGGAKAQYDGIVAFSQTDFTNDLKGIDLPCLIMHGDADQVVPYKTSSVLAHDLVKNSVLKIYEGLSHGMPTINHDIINADILTFIEH